MKFEPNLSIRTKKTQRKSTKSCSSQERVYSGSYTREERESDENKRERENMCNSSLLRYVLLPNFVLISLKALIFMLVRYVLLSKLVVGNRIKCWFG